MIALDLCIVSALRLPTPLILQFPLLPHQYLPPRIQTLFDFASLGWDHPLEYAHPPYKSPMAMILHLLTPNLLT
ncbi:hypothetical protein SLA2020_065630 [Shorea laevis]